MLVGVNVLGDEYINQLYFRKPVSPSVPGAL